jgi:hypothetical protein
MQRSIGGWLQMWGRGHGMARLTGPSRRSGLLRLHAPRCLWPVPGNRKEGSAQHQTVPKIALALNGSSSSTWDAISRNLALASVH